jgi:hypothetical protein
MACPWIRSLVLLESKGDYGFQDMEMTAGSTSHFESQSQTEHASDLETKSSQRTIGNAEQTLNPRRLAYCSLHNAMTYCRQPVTSGKRYRPRLAYGRLGYAILHRAK